MPQLTVCVDRQNGSGCRARTLVPSIVAVAQNSFAEPGGEAVFSLRWDLSTYVSLRWRGCPGGPLRQSSWMSEKLSKDAEIAKIIVNDV